MEKIVTTSVEQTKELGKRLAKSLKAGDVLCLYGNLGSGKTSFVQGLAKGLGIDKRIISPTFIIMRSHKAKNANFYHVDLYRISNSYDYAGLGLIELINSKESILAIEWAEKLGNFLPKKRIDLHFEYVDSNTRRIKINKYE